MVLPRQMSLGSLLSTGLTYQKQAVESSASVSDKIVSYRAAEEDDSGMTAEPVLGKPSTQRFGLKVR